MKFYLSIFVFNTVAIFTIPSSGAHDLLVTRSLSFEPNVFGAGIVVTVNLKYDKSPIHDLSTGDQSLIIDCFPQELSAVLPINPAMNPILKNRIISSSVPGQITFVFMDDPNLDIINFYYEIHLPSDQKLRKDLIFQTPRTSVEIFGLDSKSKPIRKIQKIGGIGKMKQAGETVPVFDRQYPKFHWHKENPARR